MFRAKQTGLLQENTITEKTPGATRTNKTIDSAGKKTDAQIWHRKTPSRFERRTKKT